MRPNGRNLLKLLRKYENLFHGTLGDFETSDVKLNLKEDASHIMQKLFECQKLIMAI
jgi:hypothetical protein